MVIQGISMTIVTYCDYGSALIEVADCFPTSEKRTKIARLDDPTIPVPSGVFDPQPGRPDREMPGRPS